MIRWGFLVAAALLLALAQIGQHVAERAVAHEALQLESGVPATLYTPGPEARPAGAALPVVILVHGWGANRAALRELARDVASAGYAAIAIDLPGHGASARPFPSGARASRALIGDVDAAVLYARVEPGFDGQRIGLLGHGLGADAVLEYASRDAAVSAVIALSPEQGWSGGYTPPNTLLLWGESQSARVRRLGREIGVRLLGAQQIRLGRGYGEFERGNAVLAREIAGAGYLGLPLSGEVHEQVRQWLAQSFAVSSPEAVGQASSPPSSPGPAPASTSTPSMSPASAAAAVPRGAPAPWLWICIGLAGSAALFAGLAGWVPRAELRPPADCSAPLAIGQLAAALAAGLLLAGGSDPADLRGPFAFFPFAGARPLLGVLAAAGAVLGAWTALRSEWQRPARGTLLAAGGLAVFLYGSAGSWLEPLVDPWLGPRRIGWTALAAALLLPYFVCTEQSLRRPGLAGWLLPALARGGAFAALIAAAAFGWLESDWLPLAPALIALLVALELACARLHQAQAGPWAAALLQSLVLAWFLTATFPLEI